LALIYSVRDLLSDLNNYGWSLKWRYASEMMSTLPLASARLSKLWILSKRWRFM